MTAVVAGVLAFGFVRRRSNPNAHWAAVITWAGIVNPLMTTAGGAAMLARRRWASAKEISRQRRHADDDVAVLADLLSLALRSGRSIRAGLADTPTHLHPLLAQDVHELVRHMDRAGVQVAVAEAKGRLAPLCRVIESATASGGPVAAAVEDFAELRRHEDHTALLAAARRLPVRLLLPLALLILPGFVVLTVGPAVIQSLARLSPIP